MLGDSNQVYFKKLVLTVFTFAIGYSVLYFLLGAFVTAILLFFGGLIFTPLALLLEKNLHGDSSRLVFIASAVFYIYTTPFGIRTPLFAEYYFFPAMMLALLLFDPKKKIQIVIGIALPLFGWLLVRFGPLPAIGGLAALEGFPVEAFRILNFLGAFLITGIILFLHSKHIQRLQNEVNLELERLNQMTRLLTESQRKAKLGSWDWDIETNKIVWSQQQYKIFGRDSSLGINYETYLSHFSPRVKNETRELVTQALKGALNYSVEHEVILQDGSTKILHETGEVYFNEQAKPIRMSGTSQDITDRKKIDNELLRSATLLEASQTIAKLGGWELTIATGELFWTAETYRINDTSSKEFNPTVDAVVSYFLPESRTTISEALDQAIKNGTGFDLELETLTTKGRKIHVRTTCDVVRQEGAITKLRGIFQDISQQKAINEDLYKVKERFTIAIDSLKFGIWDWNLKTGALVWDNTMYEIFGIKKQNFTGDYDAFEKTLLAADADRIKQELEKVFQARGDHFESEFRILSDDGEIKYIKTSAKCFYDRDGNIERLVGANWDNTAKRHSEVALVASAKMASLGEMAGGIAHEINNPLTIIMGIAGIVKKRIQIQNVDIEVVKEDLKKIEQTIGRISKIINGLRSFSRNAEGDAKIPAQISKIIEESLDLCREKFKNYSIELRVDCNNEAIVNCRPSQISQVIMNLLSNAHDAVAGLAEKWVSLDISRIDNTIRIAVTDSGKGISKEIADKIMQPFYTTKAVGRGTGLGLSISKGIIDGHQGKFFYDSLSKNTRFVIELPAQPFAMDRNGN